ncbi:Uncharacterized protein conserved in archaea [Archaeoglobus sulfaticallidus PM70-1]|uniref:UPF0147 protein Asulf_01864 n=1 Tax=Archaeoglobus sulfaticallidus PM70-1 TaxID=387631 RepID=N0BHP4_9EURY|nr:UPF0147 family protein [Archaeoglobus sulfaticallidus]AGK61832.1 Uncharacterized protein conserved in archaea [Archaeoglobus sulfaticallidus PM70-1]
MAKTVPQEVLDVLDRIIFDDSVPRNIRKLANEIKEDLIHGEESLAVRASSAISQLEEVASDPNLPMHVRTLIWNVSSQLERISVDE